MKIVINISLLCQFSGSLGPSRRGCDFFASRFPWSSSKLHRRSTRKSRHHHWGIRAAGILDFFKNYNFFFLDRNSRFSRSFIKNKRPGVLFFLRNLKVWIFRPTNKAERGWPRMLGPSPIRRIRKEQTCWRSKSNRLRCSLSYRKYDWILNKWPNISSFFLKTDIISFPGIL